MIRSKTAVFVAVIGIKTKGACPEIVKGDKLREEICKLGKSLAHFPCLKTGYQKIVTISIRFTKSVVKLAKITLARIKIYRKCKFCNFHKNELFENLNRNIF